MDEFRISQGEGRTRVMLSAQWLGRDLVIYIYNENAHIGAIALGEYDPDSGRVSTSVITRLGHKDDVVAQKAAYRVCKSTKRPVCVIAGVHVDRINRTEIDQTLINVEILVDRLVQGDFLSTVRMG
jgi:hypothetical protein